jgi:photosystem II stability/assembly factor-like uncharacterized protein
LISRPFESKLLRPDPPRPDRKSRLPPEEVSTMLRLCPLVSLCVVLLLSSTSGSVAFAERKPVPPPGSLEEALSPGLTWREVGPYRGGRVAAVTGVPGHPQLYYMGATGGGVWKTEDGGTLWKNVSDGFFGGSIGAVAVSEWDPNVVYVGGGEKTVRGNVSHGDGVWKSTDAGRTWKHVGLADSRHIPRLRIHPKDPDLVYAAVLGHLFGPSDERGVYRSRDGGASWQRVLFVDRDTGAVDLALDPTNPRVLYASFWRVRRTPYSLESGGPGSGLWKSTDGGDTWEELTGNSGLPRGTWGINGIAVSPTDPDNLYAMVEAEEGGVFRSRDGGKTWQRTNQDRALRQRAWYYTRIYADPADVEAVYVLNVRFHRSKDGGKTFTTLDTPHGDNHDLWIAPEDPLRMIEGNDGGANVSRDGGTTWTTQANQPTAQMYRVSTDNAFPYRLLGGQQDNTALRIRSRSAAGPAIGVRDWEPTAGGESGHVAAKPDDPDVVFGGSYGGYLIRVDHRTNEARAVNPWPDNPMGAGAAELAYRFQWNFPLFFSPHDPGRLYAAANVLFESRDGGQSWREISGDLTRGDKSKMGPSGGPITKDNTSVEYYGTIFAATESPLEPGVLWTGSDDGLVHLSRDGGATWQDVTPEGMPEWALINSIEAHPREPGGLYLAATLYKWDDFRPYLYKTADYGKTWTRIDQGIAAGHFTRVVRADPDRPGLLYAGTERGVYVSFDDGGRWQPLQLDLPVVPVTDLAVKEKDLVAATQGRGYWILDDLSVLHGWAVAAPAAEPRLLAPRPAYRLSGGRDDEPENEGANPPPGVLFHYFLPAEPAAGTALTLELLEEDGTPIRTFTRQPTAEEKEKEKQKKEERLKEDPRQLPAEKGLNRFAWNLAYPAPERFAGLVLWNDRLPGARAVPGRYRARLTVGDWSAEVPFEVLPDPRSSATAEDFRLQFEFLRGVGDKLTETHWELGRLRAIKKELQELAKRLEGQPGPEPVVTAAKALEERLTTLEEALYQTRSQSPQDPLNFPIRLNDKLAGVLALAALGDARPTDAMVEVRRRLTAAIDQELARLRGIWDQELPELNRLAARHQVDLVALPPSAVP